ncbi:MAG: amino acid ABC transporter substrate-binding protein [Clostridiales bacterium]|nr:amino acid ABC transporter substrate-binding protein [Clostridiales bacterium]
MKKKIISILMLVIMVFSLGACGNVEDKKDVANQSEDINNDLDVEVEDNSWEYVKNNGKLILGLDDSFPPMGFRDDRDNIVGFDIDLAKAVCEKLGVELVLQPIEWSAKEQELATKNIDCIWNGFSVTEERLANLTMSIPYMENTIAMVVVSGSDIKTKEDMAGKRLAVQGGSSAEETLNSPENTEFRESLGEVNGSFKDYVTALMDLETGNSDAVLMDSVVANYMINEAGKDFVVLDDSLIAEEYAIGFRKGEEKLAEAVNNALRELKADGTVEGIATDWFGSDTTIIN